MRASSVSTLCVLLVLAGTSAARAASRQNVVTVATVIDATNPNGAAFTCDNWFDGSANKDFIKALGSFGLKGDLAPAVSCRFVEEVVHKVELLGAKPGTNLADDPRKMAEGTASLRALGVSSRPTLYVNYQYTVTPAVSTPQEFFDVLNTNIRNGNFAKAVEASPVPLLTALAYQETYNSGPDLGPGVAC